MADDLKLPPAKRLRSESKERSSSPAFQDPAKVHPHTQQASAETVNAAAAGPDPAAANLQHTVSVGITAEPPRKGREPSNGPEGVKYASLSSSVGAYSQRERHARSMEEDGQISFQYVENNGQPENMMRLVALKNVFSKQLPNMPREYISRLVLDRNHRSVALAKGKCSALGGITYRPFHEQAFAEIAFCAVAANEQVKGFGTRLMNHAKEFAKQRDGIRYFLTYADNAAVGYFLKQGFTKEPKLDKEIWQGFIKEYDSVTLMECEIAPQITHTDLPAMFEAQKDDLDARMRLHSHSHIVHPGLPDVKAYGIGDIPGVKEAAWSPDSEGPPPFKILLKREVHDPTPLALQQLMLEVLQHLLDNDGSWPFREPVSAADVPDYHSIIKDPIDLGTMKELALKGGHYITLGIFIADMRRMCQNARVYNAADTLFYKLADKMEALFEQFVNGHLTFQSSLAVL
ncbi:hypothetical protein WJX73_005921 [Symbiochloris irregularis]|uniref:histone acetyltransferase n=1 Tax=Symbiochloris irregularis TaxID=706552 RepID=A0AAW1NK36_9CHLO